MSRLPYTKDELEIAAKDALHLAETSPIVANLMCVDIVSRQLFLLSRQGLAGEIGAWDVKHPELVQQVLGNSAQERAVTAPITAVELHQQLFEVIIPTIEAFIVMEKQHEQNKADRQAETVPGDDPGSPQQL